MAKFLTTRGTTSEIENIINNAQAGIVIISPFVKIADSLFQNLKVADRKGLKISIVYGKKSKLEQETIDRIQELAHAKVYYLENLHAKCYFNENSMVITSLNLYDYSEQYNREMGVLVTKQDDEAVYNEAIREANMIMSLAARMDLNTQAVNKPTEQQPNNKESQSTKSTREKSFMDILSSFFGNGKYGYCIGCRTKIEYDEFRPYCPECYGKWRRNMRQKGNYCHDCGEKSATSINKPVCRSCWENTKQFR